MDVTIFFMVLCLMAAGLFVQTQAALKVDTKVDIDDDDNTCLVSLVIPQEKIKSSCDEKGKSNMKMQSIVSEVAQVQRNIGELNVRLTRILSREKTNNPDVKVVNERIQELENLKLPNIESRVSALEEDMKYRKKFGIPKKRFVKVLKRELQQMKKNIIADVTKEILKAVKKEVKNKDDTGVTSEVMFNQIKTHKGKSKDGSEKEGSEKEGADAHFSKSFNRQLESLSRQFQYEATQSAINNELPGKQDKQDHENRLQADGQFDPKMDKLIEIFKNELTENLDQQTEKVKAITNRHLNEVEGKMSKILKIIEGIHAKYDNKLADMAIGLSKSNSSAGQYFKVEHLENDIKTLAAGIASLRSNFLADPQFQQLFKQEMITMEGKMSDKFHEFTEPLRQEILYFTQQLEKSKTDQILAQTSFQNYRADLRVKLHFMEKNITSLNDQFTVVNETLLYPDYQEVDMEEADRELKISRTLYFVENLKTEWPYVVSNLTHLVDLHETDIDIVKTNFTNTKKRYDELKESQKDLLKQILDIEDNMETFKDSLNEVERFTMNGALESNQWIAYDFKHTYGRTSCYGGKRYVRRTGYKVGKFAGVLLCNATRYKIYLSDSLNDTFLDIGDAENLGEDHCEFVGANKTSNINVEKTTHIKMERLPGYFRHRWGQTPTRGNITFFWPTPYWYECGVRIPE